MINATPAVRKEPLRPTKKGDLAKCPACGKMHFVKSKTFRVLGFNCDGKFRVIQERQG